MRKASIGIIVLCGLAGFALTPALAAGPEQPVDFYATVTGVRQVPAGNPLPGLHIDAKVNGKDTDIYIAPMNFVQKYDVKVSKGDDLHIRGSQVVSGEADIVLTRELDFGTYGNGKVFKPNLTIYLRNDDGPFWNEETKPAHLPPR